MDNADLVELAETQLDQFIHIAHKTLSYWWILRVILSRLETLVTQADIEYYLRGGK